MSQFLNQVAFKTDDASSPDSDVTSSSDKEPESAATRKRRRLATDGSSDCEIDASGPRYCNIDIDQIKALFSACDVCDSVIQEVRLAGFLSHIAVLWNL